MLEHKPRVGKRYEDGLKGQKIAIVGYSHWLGEDKIDHEDFTVEVLENVINGVWNIAFFNQIKNYFNYSEHKQFWEQVIFFNFVPYAIGNADRRFDKANETQVSLARDRFFRILEEHTPSKVFVFSKKGWQQLPRTLEEVNGGNCTPLKERFQKEFPDYFEKGTYPAAGKTIAAYGLRHPQGARNDIMKLTIEHIIEDHA